MAIDIVGMIRGRRDARAEGIEELAQRLAAGEAIAPEEIEAHLERTGVDEEILQAAVDRIERRAGLLAAVARGIKAQAKADKLQAEIDAAWQVVVDAQAKFTALKLKHADELLTLRQTVDAADRAGNELLQPENLSAADAARLAAARKAASDAAASYGDLRRSMPDLRMSLENAQRVAADAVEQARLNRHNADIQANKQRSENAVSARKARLAEAEAELPRLQAAAATAAATVEAIEQELQG